VFATLNGLENMAQTEEKELTMDLTVQWGLAIVKGQGMYVGWVIRKAVKSAVFAEEKSSYPPMPMSEQRVQAATRSAGGQWRADTSKALQSNCGSHEGARDLVTLETLET
jgi:hypothetical protein